MPTPLDDELESHVGPEPRVVTDDVRAVLQNVIRPGEDDGAAVAMIAERADVSPRTVYRVLNPNEARPAISLALADKLCVACGVHIAYACRLVWPDGVITPYLTDVAV